MLETASPEASERTCALLGIRYSEVHLRAAHWVAPTSRVTIRFEHVAIAGEVLYSKPMEGSWLVCIGFASDAQGRVDPRFPVHIPATVIALRESGSVRTEGMITDVCRSGLGLTVSQSMAPGTMICIETGVILVIGSVRHCYRQKNEELYRVGMEITDVLHGVEQVCGFSRRLAARGRSL
jgi:hypothetical protein